MEKKYYIPTLDGWRALAILGVIACHAGTAAFINAPNIHSFFSLGSYGVQIFFSISGFLITKRLLEEESIENKISLKNFYIRRFFRILPAAWFFLIVIYILQLTGILFVDVKSWVASIFFYKNYIQDNTWYLSHFWSLAIEEQFYLILPLVIILTPSINRKWVTFFLFFIISVFFDRLHISKHFAGLVAGSFLAILFTDKKILNAIIKNYNLKLWFLLVLLMILGIANKIHMSNFCISWVITLVVIGTVINPDNFIGRILELKILKTIGKYSFSLYLWQQLFCISDFPKLDLGPVQKMPANILLTFLMALISYHLIERPFIKLSHKISPPVNPGKN
ncbi:MAG: acyltransferase [Bacteriovorax sp.]|nr:acyltransferase [Bacteriovorax sp.]